MMRIGLRTLHPFKFSGTLFQDVDDKSAYMGDMKGCKPRISAELDIKARRDINMDISNLYIPRVTAIMSLMSNVYRVNTAYTF